MDGDEQAGGSRRGRPGNRRRAGFIVLEKRNEAGIAEDPPRLTGPADNDS